MANSDAPAPAEGGTGAAAAPQRRISGLLIFSLILSLAGYLPMVGIRFPLPPVIGPLAGLLLAGYGLRGVRRDPLIIGPLLGRACLVVGILSLAVQSYMSYKIWPTIQMNVSQGKALDSFMLPLKERKWEEAYQSLDQTYRDQHTLEEFDSLLAAAFPGEGDLQVDAETVRYPLADDEAALRELGERADRYRESQDKLFMQDFQLLITHEDAEVDLNFTMRTTRSGFSDFETSLMNVTVRRIALDGVEPANEESAGVGESGSPSGTEPADDPGKTDD
jgi:hypothetical protein